MSIEIITPQFEREYKLYFETLPSNAEEFYRIVNDAPIEILKGFGFSLWSTMNEVIAENRAAQPVRSISLPTINLTDDPANDTMKFEIGRRPGDPVELLEKDMGILLFPAEWYDIIPDGFKATGLRGQEKIFEKGETDNDRRFGCLGYGILRPVE